MGFFRGGLQMLRMVVIPVVLPGILIAAIFAFTLSFQESGATK
jgi:ABC-type spermidine/putrescine transport system permease subunit II